MNTKEVDASGLDAVPSTIEANAIKKIVRENWESKLKERGTSLDILNEHAEFMTKEFGAMNYETLCMQNIAARSKHMSKGELAAYTRTIEALALGYKARFGPEFAEPLIAGVALLSKDVRSARKHLDYFVSHVSDSAAKYELRITRETGMLERIDSEFRRKNSGMLRFLRKREIDALGSRLRATKVRILKLERKKIRCAKLANDTRARADPHAGKKQ
ncbi:MAG: hypothetical protein KGH57_00835 [Candidatus Micrarchaeota archaeon]|nr:hypothetical protein [Candidatus Micrarchaeota archaeon]